MLVVTATTYQGAQTNVEADKFPDHCPLCHHGIEASYLGLAHAIVGRDGKLEFVFRCPRENCQAFFIARYFRIWNRISHLDAYTHSGSFPFEPYDKQFSEHIKRISPNFCEIANQAQKADHQGWKLVAGPGYRKALEFLIKDYLCLLLPNEVEKIKGMQLGACIATHVKNEKVKATAARAGWLGNDETHYTRKWEGKDLDDLKKLIELTVHWIEMEEMTDGVVKEMPVNPPHTTLR